MKKAYGFIEMMGLASAVVAVDTALKAANVELEGLEAAKGGGWHTIKLTGEVSAVKAAVSAILAERSLQGKVRSHTVIPRPSQGLETLLEKAEDQLPLKKNPSREEALPEAETVEETPSEEPLPVEPQPFTEETVETEPVEEPKEEEAEPFEDSSFSEDLLEPAEPGPETVDNGELVKIAMEVPRPRKTPLKKGTPTCNLCQDPTCPRKKGEPRNRCIHHKEKE
ncbi:BMC domain-containing protein [Proteiniclasticum sp. BAD-10]|uniref:BMC domain-containing protein n=1 Tax=Proteiniclasticum sediminis TaxID=2804028 RepID=A0A941CN49_9CLOT|nr:BMC domain-containing protein [Proteiniclasticum sediminis]MBR0575625.1 BMC domain-containing protein [Proteiniclasticum sediminis]